MSEPTNPLKEIKHLFFTYRNGALAETLRRYGDPHKLIFGLDIPRIASIAGNFEPNFELACSLWADRDVRESRILATYLFPLETMEIDNVLELCADIRNQEEADMLAFRLLKRLPYAKELHEKLNTEKIRKDNPALVMAAIALNQLINR